MKNIKNNFRQGEAFLKNKLNLLEIKQIVDLEKEYKRNCMKAIHSYKSWRISHQNERDVIGIFYGDMEGKILRHHAENLISAYWVIRQDLRKILLQYFMKYIGKDCASYDVKNDDFVFLKRA